MFFLAISRERFEERCSRCGGEQVNDNESGVFKLNDMYYVRDSWFSHIKFANNMNDYFFA